jgi:plasmid stability protein
MAQLILRDLEEELVAALERRASRLGRSAEVESLEILREALARDRLRPGFKAFILSIPDAGADEDFAAPRGLPREFEW